MSIFNFFLLSFDLLGLVALISVAKIEFFGFFSLDLSYNKIFFFKTYLEILAFYKFKE